MASYFERARGYALAVTGGGLVAGKFERLAAQRFLNDLARPSDDAFPYAFDEEAGSRACRFMELLPHIKGEWARPTYVGGKLSYPKIKLEDWQVFIVINLFGWKHVVSGLRRFRRSYKEVARKNAKSTLAAGIMLFALTADGEPGAQVYSVATTGDQAREVFDVAREMARREPEFQRRFRVDIHMHDLTVPDEVSVARPLNAEASTLDGLNVHFAIVDELHAHKTRALYDVIDSATGARSQPMICMITTAGSNRAGICYENRYYTIKVLEGTVVDETWFGIIYTLDEGDSFEDPTVWRKANPNLGVSVMLDDLQAAVRKAAALPSAIGNVLTKRFNVWVNADSTWMDMQAWDRCANASLREEDLSHLPCWVPLDLANKIDVVAGPKLFHDPEIDRWYLITRGRFWLPEKTVENGTNAQYDGWVREGYLVATPGNVTDFSVIEDTLRNDAAQLADLREVPFDPWQATQLASNMVAEGLPMVEVRQTVANLSEPMKHFEALVMTGPERFQHDANPMMTWMVSNVVCHRDAKDNIYPRKERVENKIDGPVAVIMGLSRAMSGERVDTIGDDYELMVI